MTEDCLVLETSKAQRMRNRRREEYPVRGVFMKRRDEIVENGIGDSGVGQNHCNRPLFDHFRMTRAVLRELLAERGSTNSFVVSYYYNLALFTKFAWIE